MIISDRAGASIALRNIQFSSRKVSPSGQVQSNKISQPMGNVVFRAAQHTADKLTSITHQVSTDNIHYQSVALDQTLTLDAPYWYRALLTRLDSNFDQAAAPVDMPGTDPGLNSGYNLQNTATTDLGGGIIERTLNFATITGPVQLEETPLDGTLVVFDGTVPMAVFKTPDNHRNIRLNTWWRRIRWPLFGHAGRAPPPWKCKNAMNSRIPR